mgnify:CR=1 FL=1
MILKSSHQLQKYQEVAKLSTSILWQLHQKVEAGVTPLEVDALAESLCLQHGVRPNFKGVGSPDNPYKYSTCISVNDTVVHGIPQDVPLKKGDLVKILGRGKIDTPIIITAHKFSASAEKLIEKAGGKITII